MPVEISHFQEVFPPHERAFAVGDRASDHIVDAAVADDRAGAELARAELGQGAERERVLASARLGVLGFFLRA